MSENVTFRKESPGLVGGLCAGGPPLVDDGPAELRHPGGGALPRLLDEDDETLPVLSLEFAPGPLVSQNQNRDTILNH